MTVVAMCRRRIVAGVLAALGIWAGAAPFAHAQSGSPQPDSGTPSAVQSSRPYRGLFGAGSAPTPGRQQFDLTATFLEEYGNNTSQDTGSTPDPSSFFSAQARLAYQAAGQRTSFALRAEAAARYDHKSKKTSLPYARAELALNNRVGARATGSVALTASVEYQPYYAFSIFPGVVAAAADVAIQPVSSGAQLFQRTSYIYAQALNVRVPMSQRTFFALNEEVRLTRSTTPDVDVDDLRGVAAFGVRLSQYGSLLLGGGYQLGQSGPARSLRTTSADAIVTLDYRRPLPRARRTSFGITSGSSRVTTTGTPSWFVTGAVDLRHDFEAGWFLQTAFARRIQMVEGFAAPFAVNTATASLGGFLGRRVDVLVSGGYSKGTVGMNGLAYRAWQGAGRLAVACSRFVAVNVEGVANDARFDAVVIVPGTLPSALNRWAVRANLGLWIPFAR